MSRIYIGAGVGLIALACAYAGSLLFSVTHPQTLVATGLDRGGLSAVAMRPAMDEEDAGR
jgi:hypothetical protein